VRNFLLVLVTLAALAVAGCVVALTVRAWQVGDELNAALDTWGGLEYLTEPSVDHLVDRLNESGYDSRALDVEDPMLKRRIILVCEGMSERVARRVVEQLVYLDADDPTGPIDLRIATSGGWTDSAFAIVDTMRSIKAPVNVTAIGGCYSAGTVILAAATGKRAATPYALLSVHVNDYQEGEATDMDPHELARFRDVYRRYTKIPREWFEQPGDNHWYLDAQQALELGLIDEVTEPVWKPKTAPRVEARPAA
jgi:ATP-dependent Clp protease protease subunit